MTIYQVLSGFKLNISKFKKYKCFQKPFRERVDKKIIKLILGKYRDCFKEEHIELLERYNKLIKNEIVYIKYHQCYGIGRHYSDDKNKKTLSIITLPRVIKHTIMKYLGWIDIDMVSAHPSIACEVGRRANKEFKYIRKYLDNRDQILNDIINVYSFQDNPITRDEAKSLFNIMAYGGGFDTWKNSKEGLDGKPIQYENADAYPFIKKYKKDCKEAKELIYNSNPEIVEKVIGDLQEGSDELKRRVCSYFYGSIENELLYSLYKHLLDKDLIIDGEVALEYDGMCFKPKDNINYQEEVEEFSNQYFEKNNFRMNFKVKDYDRVNQEIIDERLTLNDEEDEEDEDLDVEQELRCIKEGMWDNYSSCKKWFEKIHFKVINTANFYKEDVNNDGGIELVCYSKTSLTTAYEDIFFKQERINPKTGEVVRETLTFIEHWIVDNKKRKYEKLDCIAPPLEPREGVYNVWKPFRMELLNFENYDFLNDEVVKEGVKKWLNHIFILCNKNKRDTEFFLRWLGQMLKYPAIKTFCPSLVSKEGAGKGTLLKLLKKIMGNSKIFETPEPERDVWGHFNSKMASAFFVVLNEVSCNVLKGNDGKFKNLITDETININGKGDKTYTIPSIHRFMITTNYDNPVGSMSKKDDRRNVIIRCSDELIGNHTYFEEMNNLLQDDRVNYALYQHLISLKGLEELTIIETDYHKIIKGGNKDIIQQFIEDFILDIKDNPPYDNSKSSANGLICVESSFTYKRYTHWFREKGIGEKPQSENSFNTCLGLRQRNGIFPENSIDTRVIGNVKHKCFDVKKLISHLSLGFCDDDIKPSGNDDEELEFPDIEFE